MSQEKTSQERIRRALDQLLYLPHLQAQHAEPSLPVASPSGGSGSGGAASASAAGRGRPWDRGDLFRRLATFKSSTWFCKPQCISPVECARRGWTNTGPDLLTCEFCKAKLSCPIAAELLPDESAAAGERYAQGLSSAHDAACPWRAATSALSLLQFPPLTEDAVRRDFEARSTALQRLLCLPPLAAEALDTLAAAASQDGLTQLLLRGLPDQRAAQGSAATPGGGSSSSNGAAPAAAAVAAAGAPTGARAAAGEGVAVLGSREFDARTRLLALCGWDLKVMLAAAAAAAAEPSNNGNTSGSSGGGATQQHQRGPAEQHDAELPACVGPESAALQCGLCAAKAGLWAFFPQCKPHVLQPPRRSTAGAGSSEAAGAHRAALAKASVSRNVAADIGTTIAGGTLQPAAAAGAAAPFGSTAAQPPVFGGPPAAAPGAQGEAGGAAPTIREQQPSAPAAATATGMPAAAPFGSGSQGGGPPAFGFAALQAARPAAPAAAAAAAAAAAGSGPRELSAAGSSASMKRKQPDFSWEAVLADIDAKAKAEAAAEKRSKASAGWAAAAGGGAGAAAPGGASAAADAAAAAVAGRASTPAKQQGSSQQRLAAAAAAAARYGSAQAAPLDPLSLHRPFCPWINGTQAGEKDGRCGWRWCLQQLAAAPAAAAESTPGATEDEEGGGGGGSGREWDPAKLLRQVLLQVDVHK